MERRLGDWFAGLEAWEQRLLQQALRVLVTELLEEDQVIRTGDLARGIMFKLPARPEVDWDEVGAPPGIRDGLGHVPRWAPAFRDLVELVLLDALNRTPADLLEGRFPRKDIFEP